ncbi:hypothetical protein [Paenibacillus odorifer]|jgi:hypothetical protein|uniref:Uncharacterized protein n=1 Tax=Paenibacillus odorifer TaxID=189426 RepID=A0ABX3GGU0_9BACL|nr:hypothetical protein [Paenibacillus odorifer]OMD04077.1 hypothetical protein BSO21_31990 [Paenibacillus odorifer]
MYRLEIIPKYLLVCVLSFGALFNTASANPVDPAEGGKGILVSQTVSNEYDSFKKIQSTSFEDLKAMGYTEEDIEYIKNFDYEASMQVKVNKLQKLDESLLENAGYDEKQITTIQNYSGTEEQLARASATLSLSTYRNGSSSSSTFSSITFSTYYNWSSAPNFLLTDIVAVPWSEGMYLDNSNSNATISYVDLTTGAFIKTANPTVVPNINTGASIKFGLGYAINGTEAYAKSGNFNYRLTKNSKVTEVAIQPAYGHTFLSVVSPTVTYPGGLAVTFSYQVSKEAENYVYSAL